MISPESTIPLGARKSCSTHAEIQLILHYEHTPVHPMPRAIGCSKSACFLCDRFIQGHSKYQVSFAHGRIYPKLTIPDTHRMTTKQIAAFRDLLGSITSEMDIMTNQFNVNKCGVLSAPMESKACLPLSQVSESTNTTAIGASAGEFQVSELCSTLEATPRDTQDDPDYFPLVQSSRSSRTLGLATTYRLDGCRINECIRFGSLTIVFDFECSSSWSICVRAKESFLDKAAHNKEIYTSRSLSAEEAIPLVTPQSTSLIFYIQSNHQMLEIELQRNSSP